MQSDECERRFRQISLAYEVMRDTKMPAKAMDAEILSPLSRAFVDKATTLANLEAAQLVGETIAEVIGACAHIGESADVARVCRTSGESRRGSYNVDLADTAEFDGVAFYADAGLTEKLPDLELGSEFGFDYTPTDTILSPVTEAVPEASTWGMLLAGFAGLSGSGYRRSRKSAAV